MFTKLPHRYGAESDEGFAVIRDGSPLTQFVLRYIEGGYELECPLENIVPEAVDHINLDSLKSWLPPHSSEPIEMAKRRQIAERICAAMHFLGAACEITGAK